MRDIDYNVLMEDGDGIFTEQVRARNHREAVREAKRLAPKANFRMATTKHMFVLMGGEEAAICRE